MKLSGSFSVTTAVVLFACTLGLVSEVVAAMKLIKCEGISNQNGWKYVGTYCVDTYCRYVVRRMFDSWCPYYIDE
jgi:hypothetical protein